MEVGDYWVVFVEVECGIFLDVEGVMSIYYRKIGSFY